MTDTTNRPPLSQVMEQARDAVIAAHHPSAREEQCLAAEIRALRDNSDQLKKLNLIRHDPPLDPLRHPLLPNLSLC